MLRPNAKIVRDELQSDGRWRAEEINKTVMYIFYSRAGTSHRSVVQHFPHHSKTYITSPVLFEPHGGLSLFYEVLPVALAWHDAPQKRHRQVANSQGA